MTQFGEGRALGRSAVEGVAWQDEGCVGVLRSGIGKWTLRFSLKELGLHISQLRREIRHES